MKHKWHRKKVRKFESTFCVNCGLIKEMSENSHIFYFKDDSAYEKAGDCPNKQIYNQDNQ